MNHCDRYDLPLSTRSDAAASAYREGIDLMLSAWPGAAQAFDSAIAADPDFALAHIARARLHFTYAETSAAKAKATTARERVARHGTAREKSHVETLALGIEGQSPLSLKRALVHLDSWPRDALVLSLPLGAFGLYAFSGRADHDQARVNLCERHASHYGGDWWFLTYQGWSHTENGNVGVGREITHRALELRRANANAAHALAHAMFEAGATDDADALIKDWLPGYDRAGLLHGHIAWHQALVALERGDGATALAVYANSIQPTVTTAAPLNAMTDGVSLLWRVGLDGHHVPKALWDDATTYARRCFPKAGVPFADVHAALAAAATGDRAGLANRVADLEARLADGKLAPGSVVPVLCRAVLAFADTDYATCARLLEPVAHEVVRIGGSHAQREVFEDTLLLALLKSGQTGKAHALLDQRLHRRPSQRDLRWRAGH